MVTIWNQGWFKFKLSTWTYSVVTSKGTIFKPLILAVWSWKVSWLFDCTKNNSLPYCVLSFPSLLLGLLYFGILYSLCQLSWRENPWGHKGSPPSETPPHTIPQKKGGGCRKAPQHHSRQLTLKATRQTMHMRAANCAPAQGPCSHLMYFFLSFPSLLLGLLYFGILYSLCQLSWRENAWGHKGSPPSETPTHTTFVGGEVGEGIWKLSTCMKYIVYRVTEHQCYCN